MLRRAKAYEAGLRAPLDTIGEDEVDFIAMNPGAPEAMPKPPDGCRCGLVAPPLDADPED